MTLILKQIFALLKLLNSDTGEKAIAFGISLGMILGLSPLLSLQSLFIFLCFFLFRIQVGAALLGSFVFAMIAFIFDPVLNRLGILVLELEIFRPVFETLYQLPIIPYTRFYNSIVMGGLMLGILLFIPIFFTTKWLVKKYRKVVVDKYKETRFFKALKATSLYKWYAKYSELYG